MKKYIYIISMLILPIALNYGCTPKNKRVLAKINNYIITKEEFEEEFKGSTFAVADTEESKKEFLRSLIDRKLILQEAQAKGLDKDKGFLKMIERFWEQSLLKIALDKKTEEIGSSVVITDKTVQEAYDKMIRDDKMDKPYDQAYGQIKWDLTRVKGSQKINDWMNDLRKKSDIEIDYDLLKEDK